MLDTLNTPMVFHFSDELEHGGIIGDYKVHNGFKEI